MSTESWLCGREVLAALHRIPADPPHRCPVDVLCGVDVYAMPSGANIGLRLTSNPSMFQVVDSVKLYSRDAQNVVKLCFTNFPEVVECVQKGTFIDEDDPTSNTNNYVHGISDTTLAHYQDFMVTTLGLPSPRSTERPNSPSIYGISSIWERQSDPRRPERSLAAVGQTPGLQASRRVRSGPSVFPVESIGQNFIQMHHRSTPRPGGRMDARRVLSVPESYGSNMCLPVPLTHQRESSQSSFNSWDTEWGSSSARNVSDGWHPLLGNGMGTSRGSEDSYSEYSQMFPLEDRFDRMNYSDSGRKVRPLQQGLNHSWGGPGGGDPVDLRERVHPVRNERRKERPKKGASTGSGTGQMKGGKKTRPPKGGAEGDTAQDTQENLVERFCKQDVTREVDEAVSALLRQLGSTQHKKDGKSSKPKQKRLAIGLREVLKTVKKNMALCVVLAPVIEGSANEGLGALVEQIVEQCNLRNVLVVFALQRADISRALGKSGQISCVAVTVADGVQELFEEVRLMTIAARESWHARNTGK